MRKMLYIGNDYLWHVRALADGIDKSESRRQIVLTSWMDGVEDAITSRGWCCVKRSHNGTMRIYGRGDRELDVYHSTLDTHVMVDDSEKSTVHFLLNDTSCNTFLIILPYFQFLQKTSIEMHCIDESLCNIISNKTTKALFGDAELVYMPMQNMIDEIEASMDVCRACGRCGPKDKRILKKYSVVVHEYMDKGRRPLRASCREIRFGRKWRRFVGESCPHFDAHFVGSLHAKVER